MSRKHPRTVPALALALGGALLLAGAIRATATATGDDATSAAGDLVPVLVAIDDIPAGTAIVELRDAVARQHVPSTIRTAGAVTDLDELEGMVAAVDLLPGEQVTAARFVRPDELGRAAVPDGLLEVTVSLDPVRALGGQLHPGQHVAVVASSDGDGEQDDRTELLLHDVLVTRVQTTEPLPERDGLLDPAVAPAGTVLVTVALDATAVEQVVFAAEHGRLWLSAEARLADVR
jgi:pilus assembly protein CpaB